MDVLYHLPSQPLENSVLTIGTFDGVHLGHRLLIDRMNALAASVGGGSVVFTFWPHPRLVLNKGEVFLLNTLEERIELLERAGVGTLIVYPFTHEFSQMSYEDFVRGLLVERIGIRKLVVGHDHQFGRNREGDFAKMQHLAAQYGFRLIQSDALALDGIEVSSTRIRHALLAGDVESASRQLGYGYRVSGRVVVGNRLGRRIGFPTANISIDNSYKLLPANGVYAVEVHLGAVRYAGMLNIGVRPTLDAANRIVSLEVHLLDFEGDLYGSNLTVVFRRWIREEQRFASLDLLVAQLHRDREAVARLNLV